MSGRGEELFVGAVVLALAPLIALRLLRGIRTGRLPVYRSYLERSHNRARFNALLAVHAASLLLMLFIAADLLLGLGFRTS